MKMNEIQMHHWPGLLLRKERKIIHKSPPSPPCARGRIRISRRKKKTKKKSSNTCLGISGEPSLWLLLLVL